MLCSSSASQKLLKNECIEQSNAECEREIDSENYNSVRDILPISKLALHAQGAPLILFDNSAGDLSSPTSVNCRDLRKGIFDKSKVVSGIRSHRRFIRNSFKGNDVFFHNELFYPYQIANPSWHAQDLTINNDYYKATQNGIEKSNSTNCNESEKAFDTTLETNSQAAYTDTVSVASEDSSGASENSLPRVIKPRKRRKKDRKKNFVLWSTCDDNEFNVSNGNAPKGMPLYTFC